MSILSFSLFFVLLAIIKCLDQLDHALDLQPKNHKVVILFHQGWCSRSREVESFLDSIQVSFKKSGTLEQQEVIFRRVDAQSKKNMLLIEQKGVVAYPTIFFVKENSWQQYEYDIKRKATFKYFMNLFFFNEIIYAPSANQLNEIKDKFQFLLVKGSQEIPEIEDEFKLLASQNHFYTFIQTTEESLWNKYEFISNNSYEGCWQAILIRKYEKFDIHQYICNKDSDLESKPEEGRRQQLRNFFEKHQKPFLIKKFNQRIRKYLIEGSYVAVALLYRKKMHSDKYLQNSFYNCTRDIKNFITGKKEDQFNSLLQRNDEIKEKMIFLFIDRDENRPSQNLCSYFSENSFNISPSVVSFHFNNATQTLDKLKLPIKYQDFILISDFSSFVLNSLELVSYLENNPIHNYKSRLYYQAGSLSSEISQHYPKLHQIQTSNFIRLFKDRYLQQINVKGVIQIIFYFSSYSRSSISLLPSYYESQKYYSQQANNQIKILFWLFDVAQNDQDPFLFPEEVTHIPEIRAYASQKTFLKLDLKQEIQNQVQNIIDKMLLEQQSLRDEL